MTAFPPNHLRHDAHLGYTKSRLSYVGYEIMISRKGGFLCIQSRSHLTLATLQWDFMAFLFGSSIKTGLIAIQQRA